MREGSSAGEVLRRRILADIAAGTLRPGDRLGSERQLATDYNVSRGTLRGVLAALEEAGIIKRVQGRGGGTFVARSKVEHDLSAVQAVPDYLARQGYPAGTTVVSARMTPALDDAARALGLAPGSLVFDIQRVRLADGRPISLDHAWLSVERFPGLLEMPLGGSIYEIMESHYSAVPAEAEEVAEVVLATEEEAAFLGVASGAPLLAITRTTFDAELNPLEYSYDLFRADRTTITMRSQGRGMQATSSSGSSSLRLEHRPDATKSRGKASR
ncbi:GntR family transcriptional regulator [Nocardioides thalensis]|uniref:GntR family transcriptional regulator n=1 Tax=Nocardioides thalensis TaxID=1914755 RepID=A0A853BXX5_9ACTN|nr:GntR family transcriptional regulator [Nocardioides thalensis]NYI99615.1 GntR family transcriptional regulator [Nocardioides thalensis]